MIYENLEDIGMEVTNDILGRKTKLRVSLADESISVSIMGRIAQCKETEIDGQKTCAFGVSATKHRQDCAVR